MFASDSEETVPPTPVVIPVPSGVRKRGLSCLCTKIPAIYNYYVIRTSESCLHYLLWGSGEALHQEEREGECVDR